MDNKKATIGIIGLGTMGNNLLMNMADSGFHVAGYDKDLEKVKSLEAAADKYDIRCCYSLEEFINSLELPRAILLSVPAGKIVDYVIADIQPHLTKGDIIIDGGNSHFPDTERRYKDLKRDGFNFIGLGISGGSEGARKGPSMMPGGDLEAYQRVQSVLESIAAKVDDQPCVSYLGKGSAGHYVKMVHNGIEYGLMQILAEAYDIMQHSFNMDNDQIHKTFDEWNKGRLSSYLVEITADIFSKKENGNYLIDDILDKSKSKGTGKWTSQDAMNVGSSIPTIDMAVIARSISNIKTQRQTASELYKETRSSEDEQMEIDFEALENAVHAAFYITYAQGLALLNQASEEYGYALSLKEVTKIWRGGCIIRADMLKKFMDAFDRNNNLANLLLDENIKTDILDDIFFLRIVVASNILNNIPLPCMGACLTYIDSYTNERLPANLIQAQRDYFGAHGFEKLNEPGTFNAEWN